MARENKPKVFELGRDMILSIGAIVLCMFVVVGATGLCTVNPETQKDAPVHEVDAKTFLEMEARSSGIKVRLPQMPEGWYTNSARRQSVAGENGSTVGYVSPKEGYIATTQTNAPLADAPKGFDSYYRPNTRTVTVDGVEATVYSSEDKDVRDLWVADLGDLRLLMSGSAHDEDYKALLAAFITAPPVPANNAATS